MLRGVGRAVIWLLLVGCATATLEPPTPGLRKRQTSQWSRAIIAVVAPGDLVVARLYGPADDDAMADSARTFSRVGVVDDDGGVVFGTEEDAIRRTLTGVVHESHRLVLVRLERLDVAARGRLAALVRSHAGEALDTLGVAPGELRARSAAFVLWAVRAVEPQWAGAPRDPADCLDLGALVFDSGPRY